MQCWKVYYEGKHGVNTAYVKAESADGVREQLRGKKILHVQPSSRK